MKTTLTYRLNPTVVDLIEKLSTMLGTTKTDVVESAVENFAIKKFDEIEAHPLHKFFGIISKEEGEKMIEDISKAKQENAALISERTKELERLFE